MKIRIGFVSNSSSSSFLIIGTEKSHIIETLLKKEKATDDSLHYNIKESDSGIIYIGGCFEEDAEEESDIELPDYAGLEAKDLLENKNVSELRDYFVEFVKKNYGIEIREEDVDLFYGESSND